MTELTCNDVVRRLSDFLDGALDDVLRHQIEAHFDGCDDCGAVYQQLRVVVTLAGSLGADRESPPMSAADRRRLVEIFLDQGSVDGA